MALNTDHSRYAPPMSQPATDKLDGRTDAPKAAPSTTTSDKSASNGAAVPVDSNGITSKPITLAVAPEALEAADAVALDPPYLFGRRLPSTTRAERARRAATMSRIVAKHFGPTLATGALNRRLTTDDWVPALRRTFEDLGTTFLKFGQLVGSAPGVFGEEIAAEFRSCLDTGPAEPFDRVRRLIEDQLGRSLDDAFATFDPEPIGRASIAVVHRATTHDGDEVAVKVLRPNVDRQVAVDLDLMQPLLSRVVEATGEQAAVSMLQQFDGFRLQLGEELDLRNEARAMEHFNELLEVVDLPKVTVPAVYPELSAGRVLTMEFIDGVPVDDLATIDGYGADAPAVIQQVVQCFLLTALRWGTFHGDVHAGNLLFRPDGRIGVIDWGIVGHLDPDTHLLFRRMIEAAMGDDTAWADIASIFKRHYGDVIEAALGLDDEGLTAFIKMMIEPVLTAPFGQVSLADMILAPQRAVAEASGIDPEDRSPGAKLRRLREQRKARKLVVTKGAVATDFDRATFLLSKQLMYFERYGKMYMSDVSLFEDREFFIAALGYDPAERASSPPAA